MPPIVSAAFPETIMVSSLKNTKGSSSSPSKTTQNEGGSKSSPLRGMDYQSGTDYLAPSSNLYGSSQGGPLASKLPKPSLKSAFLKSSYTKIYDLYQRAQKATGTKQATILQELQPLLESWLQRKSEDDARFDEVAGLLNEVSQRAGGGSTPTTTPTTTTPSTTNTSTQQTSKPPTTTPTTTTNTNTNTTPTPTSTTPTNTNTPTTTTQTQPQTPTNTTTLKPPPLLSQTPPQTSQTPPQTTPTTTQTPTPTEPEWKTNASIQLKTAELIKLTAPEIIQYIDARPSNVTEPLGKDAKFVTYFTSFDVENCAQIGVRLILRTPDTVVEKGASRAEAIRILSSQLRDKEVIKRLLNNEARVIIVPSNKLMTDLPEFASVKGTYTFDGRPWDTTRGLGGKNTAITEENLLGISEMDQSIGRKGWASQTAMETALKNKDTKKNEAGNDGPSDKDGIMNNPGVYCEGYSTTNHEFFHTIHQYGLSSQDSKLIQSEYDKKKKEPRTTEWADGPRQLSGGGDSENYSSSTVYEYFAQTGCAYQGTNTGTDPYTSRPRNNGSSWVSTNEKGLLPLYQRICSADLKNANPQAARKKADEEKKKKNTPPPTPISTQPTPTPTTPPQTGVIGLVQNK